jgi:hypothetical protein
MTFIKTNFDGLFSTINKRKPRFRQMLYEHELYDRRKTKREVDGKPSEKKQKERKNK